MEIHILAKDNETEEYTKLVHYYEELGYERALESSDIHHFYCKLEREAADTTNEDNSGLNLDGVTNQRELLNCFWEWYNEQYTEFHPSEKVVNNYLKTIL